MPRQTTQTFKNQKARKQPACGAGDAKPGDRRRLLPGGKPDGQQRVQTHAADPGLDAEPTAGDEGAHQRRHVGAAQAEGRTAIDRERNAVTCAGVGVQGHRDQHDTIAQEDGEHRLPPVHAAGDE